MRKSTVSNAEGDDEATQQTKRDKKRDELIPQFSFTNACGKQVSFWLVQELNSKQVENPDSEAKFVIDSGVGNHKDVVDEAKLKERVKKMLKHINEAELKRPNLYLNF